MHDCVSGLVMWQTEVSFCPMQCVKDRVKREGNKRASFCFLPECTLVCGRLCVCVQCYSLLFIVGWYHSKQTCSTVGSDAKRTVGNGTNLPPDREFRKKASNFQFGCRDKNSDVLKIHITHIINRYLNSSWQISVSVVCLQLHVHLFVLNVNDAHSWLSNAADFMQVSQNILWAAHMFRVQCVKLKTNY